MHAQDAGEMQAGKPRAPREEILRMAADVEKDTPVEIIVILRSGRRDTWKPIPNGEGFWRLEDSTPW